MLASRIRNREGPAVADQDEHPTRRVVTMEIEMDVDVPGGAHWSNELANAVEDWLAIDVLADIDGSEVTLQGVRLRVDGHSVTRIATASPYR
jgi:hypothetical protein